MSTLLLRLIAPMQSWGVQSRFRVRDTGREPSKSGIVGLLCAALGRPRSAPVDDLAALRMGVRVDQEGRLLRDYHTAGEQGYLKASGSVERKNLITSTRYYLADAAFLVGLEGDRLLLSKLQDALHDPTWNLFLGRKAFVPSEPVWLPDGLREEPLEAALRDYPWIGRHLPAYESLLASGRIRVVLDDASGDDVRADHPISFEKGNRQFAPRRVRTTFFHPPPWDGGERHEEP
jgi:CRISPR system Cascade subunit CasD